MPKILPLPKDKFKRFVISNIDHQCNLRGISREEQRIVTQCSTTTYNRRRKNPGEFTLDELSRIANKLKIPVWELLKEEKGGD